MRLISGLLLATTFIAGSAGAQDLTAVQTLGRSIFFDSNLSVNGAQSCASCHEPSMGFTSPRADFNAAGAVVEGAIPARFGNRKPPSMAYASESPVLHHVIDEGDVVFVGGAFLDGRATGKMLGNPTADQAQGPFLNPLEMAMPHAACVVRAVLDPANPEDYPVTPADIWGSGVPEVAFPEGLAALCADPGASIEIADAATQEAIEDVFAKIAYALSAFEASAEVNRFSSRYDDWVAGRGQLSADELAGLELFSDPDKGNCAACHVLSPSTSGGPAVLTDWTFDNLGVPRNRHNPFYAAAADNAAGQEYIDPGLGGFLASDPIYAAYAEENMGRQQVPTLRNLTTGAGPDQVKAYMHNGYFKTLEGVVHFYNTRDVLPRCADDWMTEAEALAAGCWPAPEIAATMNSDELGDLKLTAAEEAQIVAFLRTLDDR